MALLSEIMQIIPPEFPIATATTPGGVLSRVTGAESDLGPVTVVKGLGINPSGALVKKYIAGQVDQRAFVYFYISYATAGALITAFSVPFPSDIPVPWQFANWPGDSWLYLGNGGLFASRNEISNGLAQCGIYKEPNGTLSLKATLGPTGIAAKFAMGLVPYFTSI